MEKRLSCMGIIGIMLASSLTIMVGSAITPALPEIGEHYNLHNYASWLVTIPALGVVIFAIPCGLFLKRWGAYITCAVGLALYGLLGTSGAIMPEMFSELTDRFLLGIATALIMTSSTALISLFYKGRQLLKMIAIQGMAIELGGVVFLSVGGYLAEISWQMSYVIYIVAFIALLLLWIFVPKIKEADISDSDKKRINGKDNSLAKSKSDKVKWVLLLAFLGMLIFFTAIVSLPSYLQIQKGLSPSFTGNYLASISLIAVIFAGIMPRVVEHFSAKISLTIAYICYGMTHLLFFCMQDNMMLYIAAIFMGIGFGFSTPLVNNLTVEYSNLQTKARNLSFYSMCIFLGQFCSSIVVALFNGDSVFLVAAILSIVTCISAICAFKHA